MQPSCVAKASGKNCGGDSCSCSCVSFCPCSAFCDERCCFCSPSVLPWVLPWAAKKFGAWPGAASKPGALYASVAKHVEVDQGESRCDETPPEEDRKEEAERPHAPARQRETLIRQTRKGGWSESERASSVKRGHLFIRVSLAPHSIRLLCSSLQ